MKQQEETQAVEEVKIEPVKKYEANELSTLLQVMSRCKNDKDLKRSSTTLSGIRVNRSITAILKEHFEQKEAVMKAFNVPIVEKEGQSVYEFADHKEADKIKATLKELEQTKYEVKGLNEIDEEEFVIFTRGLSQGEVGFLAEYLMK